MNKENRGAAPARTHSSCQCHSHAYIELGLRVVAVGATLAAAIVMAKAEQALYVFGVPFKAKYSYSPALVFFVVANALACLYGFLTVPISLLKAKAKCSIVIKFLVFLLDLAMVALVMAALSAASSIAYVGLEGNSHTHWLPICNNFDRFCNRLIGALATSFIAVVIFMLLTLLSAISLYKHT